MPLSKLQFRPGVNRESTTYSNEGGYWACDKIRFRSGFPEKLGGWRAESYTNRFDGVARTFWNWVTLDSENLLAIGTNQLYLIQYGIGGVYYDITPERATVTGLSNIFTTANGSKLVTVTHAGHGAKVNSYVIFSGVSSAVGGISAANLTGQFEIVNVINVNSYNIIASTAATSSATGGGASITAKYLLDASVALSISSTGYGGDGYGVGVYSSGSAIVSTITIPLWSQDNYGQDIIFAPRKGAIYYWTKDTLTWARGVLLSSKANATNLTNTSGTSAGVGTTITVGDSSFIDLGSVVSGTNVTSGTYVTAIFGNTITLSAATTGAASGNYAFSYAGRFIPNQVNAIATSDISNFFIALGANPYDPTNAITAFDPMLVRWSDQDNPYEWVPKSTNQAGEQRLANGSYLVTAQNTRQEILVWSDAALFSMQYLGPPYVWGFNLLMDNISIISPNAAATVNSVTFWMGVDKFYQYSGRVETLPCTLRQYVFENINYNQIDQIVCGTNEGYNEIWWHYPSTNSLVNDRYVIYNHLERIWYYGTMGRTAWLDSPLRGYPLATFSVQTSYLSTAIGATDTSITLINASTYSNSGTIIVDSEQITYTDISVNTLLNCTRGVNGTIATSHVAYSTALFYGGNTVYDHEVGVDDLLVYPARPITAYIESSDFDIDDGHNFGFVWRMLPDLDFADSNSSPAPYVILTLKARQNSGSAYVNGDIPTVTAVIPISADQYTGEVFTRVRGRQMSYRIESTAVGTDWQLGAPRIDIRPDGRR